MYYGMGEGHIFAFDRFFAFDSWFLRRFFFIAIFIRFFDTTFNPLTEERGYLFNDFTF